MLSNINDYIKHVASTHDDDSIDRLNYVYTIYLLLGFAVTLFAKNYVGEPIQCWVPNQWKDNWESFSESYCFVENTYFVPMNDSIPDHPTRQDKEMLYYQWVPFVLSAMALFFYLPRVLWKALAVHSGLTLAQIMSSARKNVKKNADFSEASKQFVQLMRPDDEPVHAGSFLSSLYLGMKLLECVNVLTQLFLVNKWLGTEYSYWGLGILNDLLHGRHWQESGHFPRVALCDLTVREMGNINNWTVQCVLMVNMFNEKIFIFLWFWFAFVALCTIPNFFVWTHRIFSSNGNRVFLDNLLATEKGSREEKDAFMRRILQQDGLLILRLVDENCGSIVASDIASQIWRRHHHSDGDVLSTQSLPTTPTSPSM